MTHTHRIILDLLSVALGNRKEITLPANTDWQEVYAFAKIQDVYGVCLDAINILPPNQRPNKKNLIHWIGSVLSMERVYDKYIAAIESFSEFCQSHNVPMLLMKGYGCSLNYPKPNRRPCGDIDIYLGKNKGNIEKLILAKGIQIDYSNDHHAVFSYQGFRVESHDTVMDAHSHKSNAYINELLEKLAIETFRYNPNKTGLILPSATFNSIHLLRHMASDFAEVRISLRHVLDWATFIAANDVDWNFIHEVARKSNMDKFLDAINAICVHYLGYSQERFPIVYNDDKLELRVLNEILTCTDAVDMPKRNINLLGKIKYGICKTKRLWRNRWKYAIVYDESLWDAFFWKARNRVLHLK